MIDEERTLAHIDARFDAHARNIKEALSDAMKHMADATLQAQRMAEEGPTVRLRQNLVATFYTIRLKRYLRAVDKGMSPEKYAPFHLAKDAVADADAVLSALKEKS